MCRAANPGMVLARRATAVIRIRARARERERRRPTSTRDNATTTSVRFQKKMRLVSLEIPEPSATKYQNLIRQNP